jgi:hypothetical protein
MTSSLKFTSDARTCTSRFSARNWIENCLAGVIGGVVTVTLAPK